MKRGPSIATAMTLIALVAVPSVRAQGEPPPPPKPETATATAKPAPAPAVILPDASLTKTLEVMRRGPLGSEHDAVAYMDLIASGGASAAQVNDFAAYVAKRGMPKAAATIQDYAVKLDPGNATLWANLGTILRTEGSLGHATSAYKKALAIDPANALAHYNLGAVYDAEKNYDAAIEEYRRALVLDPELADPRKNPQVVNNELLLAVKLQIYNEQAGALGLPLLQMQKPEPPKPPEKPPEKTPDKK